MNFLSIVVKKGLNRPLELQCTMLKLLLYLVCTGMSPAIYAQDSIPYESRENFEFELDYSFKIKPPPAGDKVNLGYSKSYTAQPLPYLKLKFGFLNLPNHYFRLRVEDNHGEVKRNKKLKAVETYVLDMGYSDDVKDRVTPHKYTLFFLSKERDKISKIEVEVEENGNLLLNGEFHGRI